MLGVVGCEVVLPHAVSIADLENTQIVGVQGARRGQRQRVHLTRLRSNTPPDIDDHKTVLQSQLHLLLRQQRCLPPHAPAHVIHRGFVPQLAEPGRPGGLGVVVVHDVSGGLDLHTAALDLLLLQLPSLGPNVVVKHPDNLRPRRLFDQPLALREVRGKQGLLIKKVQVAHAGGESAQLEPVNVEVGVGQSPILHRHLRGPPLHPDHRPVAPCPVPHGVQLPVAPQAPLHRPALIVEHTIHSHHRLLPVTLLRPDLQVIPCRGVGPSVHRRTRHSEGRDHDVKQPARTET
mmetsp:Transcript_42509/g.102392  ORF Transcript_42509/g.102392 Transcript_42509/m.102392 type:complete len:290 (+) Transcript_42509:455-1324(+)